MWRCICQDSSKDKSDLDSLSSVHESCAALHEILLPGDVWLQFLSACNEPQDSARHRSVLLLAFQRGTLATVTRAVHNVLLEPMRQGKRLTNQYVNDLAERWWMQNSVEDRHDKSKIFMGRLAELLTADYLRSRKYMIFDLEAFGAIHDIVAQDETGAVVSIEAKYIGDSPEIFDLLLQSLNPSDDEKTIGGSVSASDTANYFFFRLYEASFQLSKASDGKMAVIVVSPGEWSMLQTPLVNQWIDCSRPAFLDGSLEWSEFLAKQTAVTKFQNVASILPAAIAELDKVLVLQLDGGLGLTEVWRYEKPK